MDDGEFWGAKLIFFDKDHTYQVDGETIPSVSEILRFISREVYESATQWRLDNAADRGRKVHEACESLDRFRSCEIDAAIEPFMRSLAEKASRKLSCVLLQKT